MSARVEWDAKKERANHVRHGIGFDEVCVLFERNADYLVIYDEQHSDDEDRFLAIGPLAKGLVVVTHTEPGEGVIRILSARMATRSEEELCYERTGGRK